MAARLQDPSDVQPPSAADRQRRLDRERLAETIAHILHGPVTLLGVIFVLVIIGDSLAEPGSALDDGLFVAGWVIWSVFALEFVARMAIAPSTGQFLRRNWWQILFLVAPFLRFLSLARTARTGRTLASAVRAGRSAAATLSARIGWLLGITLVVILGSAELLFQVGAFRSMAEALHASALSTITGEPLRRSHGLAQALDIVLGMYSVVVFAGLAGALGAFFLDRRREQAHAARPGAEGEARRAEGIPAARGNDEASPRAN